MKKLLADRVPIDAKDLKFRVAAAGDFDRLVEESVDVFVDGQLEVAFRVLPELPADLAEACHGIQYQETARTDGLVTRSRTLGFLPRVTLRRDFCAKTSMARQHPWAHEVFCNYAARASKAYAATNPARYAQQEETVSAVLPEWRIPGSVFTSGIVNHNNSLRYHQDSGNFKNLWSAMYSFSFDTRGGVLAVPELRLGFSFQRPSLILFDGAALLHGVTPIERLSSMGARFSVVFYAMKAMCNCLKAKDELERIRTVKTRRELARAAGKKV